MDKYKTMGIVNILFTGGWDSTYRIIELSRKEITVQPYYVYGDGRLSEKQEIKAIETILKELKKKSETKAKFLPVKYIDKKEIPQNREISEAYKFLRKDTNLGSQHEWLARLAYIYPGLEIGIVSAPLELSKILTAIKKYGKLIRDDNRDAFVLDPHSSRKELMLVLGNLLYPIIDKTGEDMKKYIDQWGYGTIMENVWSCHTPIFGKPCGLCYPCIYKIETGMSFLFPDITLKRYRNRNKLTYKFMYRIIKKFNRQVARLGKPFNAKQDVSS